TSPTSLLPIIALLSGIRGLRCCVNTFLSLRIDLNRLQLLRFRLLHRIEIAPYLHIEPKIRRHIAGQPTHSVWAAAQSASQLFEQLPLHPHRPHL
ncbi:MAG TPA: hypothetical protein PL187_23480, partial [Caldilinea sp.]|nr:hypothetical protein [Caldilinea sp.]